MTIGSQEGLIRELPSNWRLAGHAVFAAVSITAAYFIFVSAPIAQAQGTASRAESSVAGVKSDISKMQGDLSEIRTQVVRQDQKIDDMKDDVAKMNDKLDRLLSIQHASSR